MHVDNIKMGPGGRQVVLSDTCMFTLRYVPVSMFSEERFRGFWPQLTTAYTVYACNHSEDFQIQY